MSYYFPLLALVGVFNAYMGYKAMSNEIFVSEYIRKSHKAWFWRKIFGEERAIRVLRGFFGPLVVILGVTMMLAGVGLMVGSQ